MNAKQKILMLTYAKFAYMQNLRICKSLPCVQGFSGNFSLTLSIIFIVRLYVEILVIYPKRPVSLMFVYCLKKEWSLSNRECFSYKNVFKLSGWYFRV